MSPMSSQPPWPTLGVLTDWTLFHENINSFLLALYRGMHAAAKHKQCNLLIGCSIATPPDRPSTLTGPLLEPNNLFVPVGHWNTDGLIIIAPTLYEPFLNYIKTLQSKGFPMISIGQCLDLPGVRVNNADGINKAMAHLAAHGHRRIAFVAGRQDGAGDSLLRLQAYWDAVETLNLEVDARLVVYGEHWDRPSRQAILDLIQHKVPFTAVLASNDASAYGVLQALRQVELNVPDDVAVMGFDDLPTSILETPPLSTVRASQFEIGYQAVMLLLKRLSNQAHDQVTIPVRLILRHSCGCQIEDILAREHSSSLPKDIEDYQEQLIQNVDELLKMESHYLSSKTITVLSKTLVSSFVSSLANRQPKVFTDALQACLKQIETAYDSPNLLQPAVLILNETVPHLSTLISAPTQLAYKVLAKAQVLIGQRAQRQHLSYALQKSRNFTQMGYMNAHLLGALTESQILEQLAVQLPYAGFSRALVAFYQSTTDDPVAFSQAYHLSEGTVTQRSQIFPTRSFPPAGLYPVDEPFHLALFSLRQERAYGDFTGFPGPDGFAAFDITDLEQCVPIVLELAAVFRNMRLYQAAIEGQRLAEQADQLKSRFLASVSHELRTPLNLLIGLSEMLIAAQDQPGAPSISDEYRHDVEQIHSNAQHLGWLIRDVLDLASSQAGQLRLTCAPVDVQAMLEPTIAAGQQLAANKGLAWESNIDGSLPQVWGDQARLRQVILNLINNAVKFTDHGQVTLSARLEEDCTIGITDTGIGISPEEQAVIFDEFRQAERTTQRGYGGMGLGLAISQRIVKMHGGEIGVHSSGQVNSGSTFTCHLPVLYESPDALQAMLPPGAHSLWMVFSQREEVTQLQTKLQQAGWETIVCIADNDNDWQTRILAAKPQIVVIAAALAQYYWEWIAKLRSRQVLILRYAAVGTTSVWQEHAVPPSAHRPDLQAKVFRIVVADDEPGLLDMNSRLIQNQFPNSKVFRARDGHEALVLIQHNLPDLVILDLHMPKLNGFRILDAMRKGETTRHIPVIVLTARVLGENDMARLHEGVATVLEKGIFNSKEILKHIQLVLEESRKIGGETQWLVRKAMAYIHKHYAGPITRSDLAHHVSVTDRYLTRCFQQELAIPPMTYLTRYRIKQAKILLTTTHKSITEIALMVGFASLSSFSQAFKREEQVSPSTYRNTQSRDAF